MRTTPNQPLLQLTFHIPLQVSYLALSALTYAGRAVFGVSNDAAAAAVDNDNAALDVTALLVSLRRDVVTGRSICYEPDNDEEEEVEEVAGSMMSLSESVDLFGDEKGVGDEGVADVVEEEEDGSFNEEDLPIVTLEEVRAYGLMVIYDKVYDVQDFLREVSGNWNGCKFTLSFAGDIRFFLVLLLPG